jgi:hypothetical protein
MTRQTALETLRRVQSKLQRAKEQITLASPTPLDRSLQELKPFRPPLPADTWYVFNVRGFGGNAVAPPYGFERIWLGTRQPHLLRLAQNVLCLTSCSVDFFLEHGKLTIRVVQLSSMSQPPSGQLASEHTPRESRGGMRRAHDFLSPLAEKLKRQKPQTGGNNMVGYCVQRNRGWHEVIRWVFLMSSCELSFVVAAFFPSWCHSSFVVVSLCSRFRLLFPTPRHRRSASLFKSPPPPHLPPPPNRDTRGTCEATTLTATYKDIHELQALTQRLLDKLSVFPSSE